ncbi:MAG: hypothetical protein QOI95_3882 [Acidimicrobiaceae bacterium]|jgi:hypothetical protein
MRSEATAERISQLHEVAARARPVALAREHVLPVLEPLRPLFPEGLRRGSTVAVGDSTSLALAVLAGPSGQGSWAAAVGVSNLGLAAAAELGVALDRLVVVADPTAGPRASEASSGAVWASVVAALVDALDVVLLRSRRRVSGGDARRLIARARERGSVLIVLGDSWPEAPDVRLSVVRSEWEGIGDGYGHLHARRTVVEASGRRGASRVKQIELWLPAAGGGVAVVDELATVMPLRTA